jgi:hypothetical protein
LEQGEPVRVIDPSTHDAYVVVRAEVYERQAGTLPQPAADINTDVPPQLLSAARAFWRDLPELLKGRRYRGRWIAYQATSGSASRGSRET